LAPDLKADVLAPISTVSDTTPITFKLRYNPGAYDIQQIWLWSYDSVSQFDFRTFRA
jgi:hypothetical protein